MDLNPNIFLETPDKTIEILSERNKGIAYRLVYQWNEIGVNHR